MHCAPDSKRLATLSSFRFFAAFQVLLFHVIPLWAQTLLASLPAPARYLVLCGFASVSFFYVLSGFVLYYSYESAPPRGAGELFSFWKRRFARLAPVFYLSLLLGALPFAVALWKEHGAAAALWRAPLYLLADAAFLGAWFPQSLGFNFPGWSISVEFFFYALFPFLLPLARMMGPRSVLAAIGGAFLISIANQKLGSTVPGLDAWSALAPRGDFAPEASALVDYLHISPLSHLPAFFLGICLARLRRLDLAPAGRRGDLFLLAAAILWVRSLALAGSIPHLHFNSFFLLPTAALAIYGGSLPRSRATRWLEAPLLVLLGEASYSLYILHVPLRDWVSILAKRAPLPELFWPVASLLFPLLLIPLSVIVYRRWELPLRNRMLRKNHEPETPLRKAA